MRASVPHCRRNAHDRSARHANPPCDTVSRIENLLLADPAATATLGARMAGALTAGMIITLSGDLGTGKTTLVRGCLRALGWTGSVKSPTYTLVEHYPISSIYLYHFDFYRFNDPEEWEGAGLAECFQPDSICLIEWPERVGTLLPPADLAIRLAHPDQLGNSGRFCALEARTEAGERCLAAITATTGPAAQHV
jgi:tRNA threonylcarbamoyladenosine biosynthesis protein TsaE